MAVELNAAQKKAVEHKGGPMLVVAGAGTGKTSVVVEKIKKLLASGVEPSEILAVTFTEKAAGEMMDRVLIDQKGFLTDITIRTFNGYGNEILREFGFHIGLASNFQLLSDQAQIVFFRERLEKFELDYFLPLSGMPDGNISNILKFVSTLKQNLIKPDAYTKFCKSMPHSNEAEVMERHMHIELARIYETYTKLCRDENFIDYDDQIFLSVTLLEERPNVQAKLKQRYNTIFIDEFQDTNPMQSRLIDLIVPNTRNIVVVGDDDQAIYGWRGATLANILSFKNRYPDTAEVTLTENYRSFQAILDTAHTLIQNNNPHRLESSLKLNKRLTSDKPGNPPQLVRFSDTAQELNWLAIDIERRLLELGSDEAPSIAILTRSNASNLEVKRALQAKGITHRVVGANPDLYTQPVVRTLLELVRTLAEPENSTSLHHTLISDLFGISNQLISPLASSARHEHELLETRLAEVKEAKSALEVISKLRSDAATWSVGRLIWKALSDTKYTDRLMKAAQTNNEAAAAVGHLGQFFDSLREFEQIAIKPTATQYSLSLPALKAAGESVDDTLGITESEVIISTIHKAKGLEWNTVYLPLLMEQTFPYLSGSKGIPIPDELRANQSTPADERLAEERRLMYVAATRARRDLILSFSDASKSGKPRKPSRFVNEMFGDEAAQNAQITMHSDFELQVEMPDESAREVKPPQSILNGQNVRLSASQASTLLECPLNFYYRFVLRAPEEPTPNTGYGSRMHALFQRINEGRQNGDMPLLADLLTELDSGWSRAGYATKAQQENAHRQARETLERIYQQTLTSPPPLHVEHDFEARLDEENIILHGRMDVILDDGGVEIRDYKTGHKADDVAAAKAKASANTQLSIYALAWEINHGELPARVALHFVDDDIVGAVSKQSKSLQTLRSKLTKAADDIRAGHYPAQGEHKFCIHPI